MDDKTYSIVAYRRRGEHPWPSYRLVGQYTKDEARCEAERLNAESPDKEEYRFAIMRTFDVERM